MKTTCAVLGLAMLLAAWTAHAETIEAVVSTNRLPAVEIPPRGAPRWVGGSDGVAYGVVDHTNRAMGRMVLGTGARSSGAEDDFLPSTEHGPYRGGPGAIASPSAGVPLKGIGVQLEMTPGGPVVKNVLPGTSASDKGIKEGDLIMEIDAISTIGLGPGEVLKKIRGPAGTEVELTLKRPGLDAPVKVKVTRRTIPTVTGWSGPHVPFLTNDVVYTTKWHNELGDKVRVQTYKLPTERWAALPSFDPRKGSVPVPIEVAIQKAWDSVGRGDPHVSLTGVQLNRATKYLSLGDGTRSLSLWFYLVSFRRDDARGEGPGVIVLMDGSLLQPEITEEAATVR